MVKLNLSSVIVCAISWFVAVDCYQNQLINKFRRSSNMLVEHVDNHEYETCSSALFKKSIKSNMDHFKCQPRETIVHLYSIHHTVEMIPNKVMVKRCHESGCYGKNSCMPFKTRHVQMAVRMINHLTQKQECAWVNVTEHTSCRCKCPVTKEECEKMNRVFNPFDCTCSCSEEKNRKQLCQRQEGMEWNEEKCACECRNHSMECSTGTEWVPRMCKCMRVLMPDENHDNRYLYQMSHN